MKRNALAALLLTVCCRSAAADKDIAVLTVGASFWSAGGQSYKILEEFLESRGYRAETGSSRGNPLGFYTLQLFEEGRQSELPPSQQTEKARAQAEKDVKNCLADVASKPWNFICFMAHSSEPFDDPDGIRLPPYIAGLKSKAAPGAKIVATMTWVKQPGKQNYAAIRKYYKAAAEKYGLLLAPSGDAFEIVEKERPDIPIFRSDVDIFKNKYPGKTDRHPSVYGQYLNSCVVFAVITGESPVGLPCKLSSAIMDSFDDPEGDGLRMPMDVAPDTARYLQETAWRAVQAARQGAFQDHIKQ